MSACVYCRMRRRKSRLCIEHFAEFLGWLSAAPRIGLPFSRETQFWRGSKATRARLIALYQRGLDPGEAFGFTDARAA